MFIIFWKNLFKCLPTTTPSSHPLISEQDHTQLLQSYSKPAADAASAASSTTKSIMIKNFNSLYDLSSASTSKSLSTPSTYSFSSSDSHSDSVSPPDFSAIFASQRFFFSSPGRSNSIIESSGLEPEPQSPLGGGVIVKKYSPDPYTDFKDSMQEMIEARKLKDVRDDWDYLHELLFCYISLNPKSTHKYIIRAFADLIICLLSSSSSSESDAVKNPQACRRLSNNISRWLV